MGRAAPEDLIRQRGDSLEDTLDERLTQERQQGFILSHTARLAAGLNHHGMHELIIIEIIRSGICWCDQMERVACQPWLMS